MKTEVTRYNCDRCNKITDFEGNEPETYSSHAWNDGRDGVSKLTQHATFCPSCQADFNEWMVFS